MLTAFVRIRFSCLCQKVGNNTGFNMMKEMKAYFSHTSKESRCRKSRVSTLAPWQPGAGLLMSFYLASLYHSFPPQGNLMVQNG